MTAMTNAAGHPDVTEISDLAEGLLPAGRGTDIRRHLGSCELCADIYASLEEIRGLLGSAPADKTMPADVAQRIDAALAAEALLHASAPEAEPADDVSRETSPAADHSVPAPAGRPAGHPQAATGPGRKPGRERRGRRRAMVLGGVLTAAVLGAGALVLQSLGGTSTTTAHGKPSASASAFSGTSVQNQVRDLLGAKKGPQHDPATQQPRSGSGVRPNTPQTTESANTLLQPQVPVPDCVRQAIPGGEQALAAKNGSYAGKRAYLVVLPDPQDSARVTAYVVDAACVGQRSAAAGTVLLKQSVDRP